ncbi:LiaG family protein [Rossellomorea vietnamensis]|uniref:LiaG family protein n=1 Tax=Rossellomorea vietnamensis TaxID=218284 RepID=UPI003CE998D8
MKNLFAIIIAVLVVGSVLLILNDHTSLFASGKRTGDNSVAVNDRVNSLKIDVPSSNTVIIPEERNDVKAELKGKGNLIVSSKGDEIKVEVKRKWFSWMSFNHDSELTVFIPEHFDRSMDINIGSGSLVFEGESSSEPMVLDTLRTDMSSGNLELTDIKTAKFVHSGSSGSLIVDRFSAKEGTVEISSGDVELIEYSGPLKGELSSGDMHVEMAELKGDISFDLSSGNVDLDLPDDSSFTLTGEASSGNISSEFPLKSQKVDDGDVSGTHGSGQYDIEISVSSGDVRIY